MPLIRKDTETAPAPAGQGALEKLRAAADDERFAAARELADQPDAVPALGAALASETNSRVRAAILSALVKVDTPESAQFILPLIRSDDAAVRTGALDALGLMPDAVGAHLGALLTDGDADVRLLACELARHLPAPAAARLMGDLIDREQEPNVCGAALDVLAEVGGAEALPALAKCQERLGGVPFVSFAIRAASERIRAKSP